MICLKCGTENDDSIEVCVGCGKSLVLVSSFESSENSQSIETSFKAQESSKSETLKMPKKVKKGKIILALAISVIAVFGFMAISAFASPHKLALKKALNNTYETIENSVGSNDKVIAEYEESYQKIKFSVDLIKAPGYETFAGFAGAGIEIETTMSMLLKEYQSKFSVIRDAEKNISVDCKLDENEIILGFPGLSETALSVSTKDFGNTFKDSVLGKRFKDMIDKDASIAFSNIIENYNQKELSKETKEKLESATKKLLFSTKVSSPVKEEITLNEIIKADRYEVEFSEKALNSYILNVFKALEGDDLVKNNPLFSTAIKEVKYLFANDIESFKIVYDVSIFIYDENIVMMLMESDYTRVEIKFNDTKSLIKDCQLNMENIFDDKVEMGLKYDDNNFNAYLDIPNVDGMSGKFNISTVRKDTDFSGSISFNGTDRDGRKIEMSLSSNGRYDNGYIDGEGRADINSLKLMLNDGEVPIELVLSGEIVKEKAYKQIVKGYTDERKLFDMNEIELIAFINSILTQNEKSLLNLIEYTHF